MGTRTKEYRNDTEAKSHPLCNGHALITRRALQKVAALHAALFSLLSM